MSYLFLFFLPLPLVCVPMKILADRVEGPQIGFWHWLLVFGPIPLLAGWLIAWIRRKPDWS